MYHDFTHLVTEALHTGLHPCFEPGEFTGVLWHGTNRENALSLVRQGWQPHHGSWNSWLGPALYGYTGVAPIVCYGIDSCPNESLRGAWTAWNFAQAKIASPENSLEGEPAVVRAEVKITRLMNLAAVENDELLERLRGGAQRFAYQEQWNGNVEGQRYLQEIGKPVFPAKLLHWAWAHQHLPSMHFPQAFRFSCPVAGHAQHDALAVIDPAAIVKVVDYPCDF